MQTIDIISHVDHSAALQAAWSTTTGGEALAAFALTGHSCVVGQGTSSSEALLRGVGEVEESVLWVELLVDDTHGGRQAGHVPDTHISQKTYKQKQQRQIMPIV